jgi:hypothetical protein
MDHNAALLELIRTHIEDDRRAQDALSDRLASLDTKMDSLLETHAYARGIWATIYGAIACGVALITAWWAK